MAYTTIDDPSAFFQTALWSGNAGTQDITNDGNSDLKPDFTWTKPRTIAYGHKLMDSTRGIGSSGKFLFSDATNAEDSINDYMMTFNTDGFSVGAGDAGFNASNDTYVTWQWKAGGGTTSSNTDGATTSTVQANTDAGFSIVTWTGTGSATTLGHGLGVAPAVLIVKNRSTAVDWAVYHKDLTDAGYVIALNSTDTQIDSGTNRWNHTDPTSSVFSVGSGQQTNQSSNNMVCYAFAEKQGYSKFGSYVGNGNANGTFVYTGFKPAFVMIKDIGAAGNWFITDHKRNPFNLVDDWLVANGTGAETNYLNASSVDYLSNGFKLRTTYGETNTTGRTYIYMAFAENPFVTSTGIPTTARAITGQVN